MSTLALGLGLAVVASLTLNGAFVLQHAGSRTARAITLRQPLASVRGLLASRLWLAGLAAGLAGWALHVGALSKAPLSLVQAFSGGGLALAAPVASWILAERLTRGERAGIALTVLALVALSIGSRDAATHVPAAGAFAGFVAVTGGLAAALLAAPSRFPRPHLLGLAGGVLYGIADAATKAVTAAAHHGLVAVLASPWLLVAVAATAAAFFAFQRGLQTGPAVPVVALMTAATNLVAIAAGLTVFGDPLGASVPLALLHAAAFGLVGIGVWLLAPAQAALAAEASEDTRERRVADPRAPLRWALRASGATAVTVVAVVAGVGLLYLLRSGSLLAAGPRLAGALPLERLAREDAQPLLRMAAAWLPAGAVAGLALRWLGRFGRAVCVAVAGVAGAALLTFATAASYAVENSEAVAPHLLPALRSSSLAAATCLLMAGAYAGTRAST